MLQVSVGTRIGPMNGEDYLGGREKYCAIDTTNRLFCWNNFFNDTDKVKSDVVLMGADEVACDFSHNGRAPNSVHRRRGARSDNGQCKEWLQVWLLCEPPSSMCHCANICDSLCNDFWVHR